MTLKDLSEKQAAMEDRLYREIGQEVNALYLANRDEFETTTVCHEPVRVIYIRRDKEARAEA